MRTVFEFHSSRDYLWDLYQSRAPLSLREFSKQLKLEPARLSEWMNGRCRLSKAGATKLALALHLSQEETRALELLTDIENARHEFQKEQATQQLRALKNNSQQLKLQGYWLLQSRHCSSGCLPVRWNPEIDAQEFEFSGSRFRFTVKRNPSVITHVLGAFKTEHSWLHTETDQTWLPSHKQDLKPWLARKHQFEWITPQSFKLVTPPQELRASICPPDEDLVTVWQKSAMTSC